MELDLEGMWCELRRNMPKYRERLSSSWLNEVSLLRQVRLSLAQRPSPIVIPGGSMSL